MPAPRSAEVEPWAETCGQIRPLIEAKDEAAAEVHHVEIDHAKLHYHAKTDEVYYIIDGAGTMVLDDETIEVHRGVVVYVPRGSSTRRSASSRSSLCAFRAACWTTSTRWSETDDPLVAR